MKQHIDVTKFVRSPRTIVRIFWQVDGSSGSTECEAWRVQFEIERLEQSGYTIVEVLPA